MPKVYPLNTPFLSRNTYIFLFSLLGIVYIIGLFVPLMDNDSAHHASIAMHMYLTGDYATLVDHSGDYLDKPHLLFWLCAFSFKLFGVNAFAYKLPSFLFTIAGVYSTYQLGASLYNKEAGRLSALIIASAFAFMLANTDVRMDAILTASITFATWQLIRYIQTEKTIYILGAALGLAAGFSTKGHIAVFVPAVTTLFYIIYRKQWKSFLDIKWMLLLVVFGLLISPVVYSYYLQYNLHPEKVVRGKDHINGVKFILLNQSVERFTGEMGSDSSHDYLFFFHSFLWAFAPWSISTYISLIRRIRYFSTRREEWATTATFLVVAILVSLSGFKLPHYLNVVFPVAAVMTASWILSQRENTKWAKNIYRLQLGIAILLLLVITILNAWSFPIYQSMVIAGVVLLLAAVFYFWKSQVYLPLAKAVALSAATMVLVFFLLNSNFYPQLLRYQAGKQLATFTKNKVDPANVYILPYSYSASYVFYSQSKYQSFHDSLLSKPNPVWVLTEPERLEQMKSEGYTIGTVYSVRHFHITKLTLKFINPATRQGECSWMSIGEIKGKTQ